MENVSFVLALGTCAALLLTWAFRTLPEERWQIMATVPRRKDRSGAWVGTNLTYYGLITASASILAVVIFLLLMTSISVPLSAALTTVAVVLVCCLPAAKLVARAVEGKQHTFSVAGAAFIGVLIAPLVVAGLNAGVGVNGPRSPIGPTVAAMAIAYVFGEGLGRLACISFGCCYGKPITDIGPVARRWFEKFHFAFYGATKKIAYASNLEGIKVVPIQAMTSALYVAVGLVAMLLFLESCFRTAFVAAVVCSQAWRIYSETLRADYRGDGKISAYQVMAALGILYAVGIAFAVQGAATKADLATGLAALWDPVVIIVLQLLWAFMFLYTGWSMVTGSVLSFHVHRDRI
jgi:hypothetical protein